LLSTADPFNEAIITSTHEMDLQPVTLRILGRYGVTHLLISTEISLVQNQTN